MSKEIVDLQTNINEKGLLELTPVYTSNLTADQKIDSALDRVLSGYNPVRRVYFKSETENPLPSNQKRKNFARVGLAVAAGLELLSAACSVAQPSPKQVQEAISPPTSTATAAATESANLPQKQRIMVKKQPTATVEAGQPTPTAEPIEEEEGGDTDQVTTLPIVAAAAVPQEVLEDPRYYAKQDSCDQPGIVVTTVAGLGRRPGDLVHQSFFNPHTGRLEMGPSTVGSRQMPLDTRIGIVGTVSAKLRQAKATYEPTLAMIGMGLIKLLAPASEQPLVNANGVKDSKAEDQQVVCKNCRKIVCVCGNIYEEEVPVPPTPKPKDTVTVTATPTPRPSSTPPPPPPTNTPVPPPPTNTPVPPPPPPTVPPAQPPLPPKDTPRPPAPPTAAPPQPTAEFTPLPPVVETPIVPPSPTSANAQTNPTVAHTRVPTLPPVVETPTGPGAPPAPTAAPDQRTLNHSPEPTLAPVAQATPSGNTTRSSGETGPAAPTPASATNNNENINNNNNNNSNTNNNEASGGSGTNQNQNNNEARTNTQPATQQQTAPAPAPQGGQPTTGGTGARTESGAPPAPEPPKPAAPVAPAPDSQPVPQAPPAPAPAPASAPVGR